MDLVATFVMNSQSRAHEFEADLFAKKLGYGAALKSGLSKLHLKNLGNLNPDSLFSLFHYSHPTLVERLGALGKTA
jgi:STE24 endopeptidase